MTRIHLVRHGSHDWIGLGLAGRMAGVHLNEQGRREAEALADHFGSQPVTAIYSSPMERAQETAAPIAARLSLPVIICDEINEFDFGDWTGLDFTDLKGSELWNSFNTFRIGTRPPGGERMIHVQSRVVSAILDLVQTHRDEDLVLVGHGDPMKSAIVYFLGLPLDHFDRLAFEPASVATLGVDDWGARLLGFSEKPFPL